MASVLVAAGQVVLAADARRPRPSRRQPAADYGRRMSTEVGLWRLAHDGPARVAVAKLAAEDELEELVMRDPSVLGEPPLLIIGRQVHTAHGGRIDLLGLDETANVHVLELKRDQTPRDVVAQTLDYTSWASALGHADLTEIYGHFAAKYQLSDATLEAAFDGAFDSSLPDLVNAGHQMTVMASSPDSATERIVRFLAETYGVAINMVYFRYFEDDGRRYLARTWLLPESAAAEDAGGSRGRAGKSEVWNGQDYYAAFGVSDDDRSWDDARHFGFFSASGGKLHPPRPQPLCRPAALGGRAGPRLRRSRHRRRPRRTDERSGP